VNHHEVSSIINSFVSEESVVDNMKRFILENKVEAFSFFAGVIAVITALAAAFFSFSTVSYISLFAFFAFLVLYSLSSFISTLRFFIGATKETLLNIDNRYRADCHVAEGISSYSTDSIEQVKTLFVNRIIYLEARVGFVVGIVDKLGIVPAIIMIYLAYIRVSGGTEILDLSPFVIGIVSGVYLGAISARVIIDALRDKIAILELSLEISSKRKAFKLP